MDRAPALEGPDTQQFRRVTGEDAGAAAEIGDGRSAEVANPTSVHAA